MIFHRAHRPPTGCLLIVEGRVFNSKNALRPTHSLDQRALGSTSWAIYSLKFLAPPMKKDWQGPSLDDEHAYVRPTLVFMVATQRSRELCNQRTAMHPVLSIWLWLENCVAQD